MHKEVGDLDLIEQLVKSDHEGLLKELGPIEQLCEKKNSWEDSWLKIIDSQFTRNPFWIDPESSPNWKRMWRELILNRFRADPKSTPDWHRLDARRLSESDPLWLYEIKFN